MFKKLTREWTPKKPVYQHETKDVFIYPDKSERNWCIGELSYLIKGQCPATSKSKSFS